MMKPLELPIDFKKRDNKSKAAFCLNILKYFFAIFYARIVFEQLCSVFKVWSSLLLPTN